MIMNQLNRPFLAPLPQVMPQQFQASPFPSAVAPAGPTEPTAPAAAAPMGGGVPGATGAPAAAAGGGQAGGGNVDIMKLIMSIFGGG